MLNFSAKNKIMNKKKPHPFNYKKTTPLLTNSKLSLTLKTLNNPPKFIPVNQTFINLCKVWFLILRNTSYFKILKISQILKFNWTISSILASNQSKLQNNSLKNNNNSHPSISLNLKISPINLSKINTYFIHRIPLLWDHLKFISLHKKWKNRMILIAIK